MRYLAFVLLSASALATGHTSDFPPTKKEEDPFAGPRQRLLHGNYAEARAGFAELTKDPKFAAAAAIGIASAWRMEGENGKALSALDDAIRAAPDRPNLRAHRADLLYGLGKWEDALKDAEAAIAKQEKQFLARWVRARIFRDKGDLTAADREVRWFVREYTDSENADRPITDPEELLIVGQAGAENATWNNRPQQYSFVLNEIYRDALKRDPDCWRAEYLAGRLLLDKHNRADALNAFDQALRINPKSADALVGKGLVAIEKLDVKDADHFADLALKVNPKHPEALRLKADVLFVGGEFSNAARLLVAAKIADPRDGTTLARLAACHQEMGLAAPFAATVAEAETHDAKPARFFFELAASLEVRRQYSKAEEYYRKAAELRPALPAPRAGLGLLLLRTGREAEARIVLEAAFKADPFDVRISNSLRVLEHLASYQTVETAHYIVRFDPKADKVLAAFLAEYLEEVHVELNHQFGYEPPGKVLVEAFSSREMFSGRTIALPSLPDVAAGACSGRVISFPTPHAEGGRPVNWGRVIRHELTHAFNLLQTDYRVPHWLTEGLAVRNERGDRPAAWVAILRDRFAAGRLLDLDDITRAFVRPRITDEWPLAYCQALLYVEYATKTYGEAAVGKLLEAYRGGRDTAAVLKEALGVEKLSFERGYRKYVEEVVRGTGMRHRHIDKVMTVVELEAAHDKNPDDPDLSARLGGEYLRRNKVAEAKKRVESALEKEPGHPLASIVKARILARQKDDIGAREVLELASRENPDDARVLRALGRAYLEERELAKAAKVFERGRKLSPEEIDWLTELARIYGNLNQKVQLVSVLEEMAARDADEIPARVKLAQIALAAGDPAIAERYAREVLHIDVMHTEGRELLLDALKAQKKNAELAKIVARFGP